MWIHRNGICFFSSQKKTPKGKHEEDPISLGKVFFDSRKAKVAELKQNPDTHPYPHKFQTSCTISEYVGKYGHLKNSEILEDTEERVAGRILSIRKASSKLYFIDLQSDGAKLQVKVNHQMFENKEAFTAEMSNYHRGDIIGIEGIPNRTKSGELSINSKTVSNSFSTETKL